MMMVKQPDTLLIVCSVLLLVTGLTWILPAGEFDREMVKGTEVLVAGSYRVVDQQPQGLSEFFIAPVKGFVAAAPIIAFVLLVGGAFGIIAETKAIEKGLQNLVVRVARNPAYSGWVVPLLMVLFSIAGATFGMSEETLLFILITIPFAHALGYDTLVGVSIPFVGAGAGFAGAVTNPFTVGIAQGIAEVPLFSGWEYRLFVWAVLTTAAIVFVSRHARRVRRKTAARPKDGVSKWPVENDRLTIRHRLVLVLIFGAILLLIVGSTRWGWYINEITGLFLATGVAAALIAGISGNNAIAAFTNGARDMMPAVLVIALAKGILIIATDGRIIDTILQHLSAAVDGFHPLISAELMFIVQNVLNFFVPSGSGQAALTMPIMAPLSDLLSLSRQTAVLTFQLGDGIGNMIIPTSGVTMGVLSAARIPYLTWVRWIGPLILILLLLSMLLLIPPVVFGWP